MLIECPKCGSSNLYLDIHDREPFDQTELSRKENEYISSIECLGCGYWFSDGEIKEVEDLKGDG